jgi:hypothetical protein
LGEHMLKYTFQFQTATVSRTSVNIAQETTSI